MRRLTAGRRRRPASRGNRDSRMAGLNYGALLAAEPNEEAEIGFGNVGGRGLQLNASDINN